jgi:exonuclease SbcC
MVPVRLELKNFLSYGTEAPPLDFGRFDVACLSGGNGEGKSALLDAMTWAVWGEARKSSGKRKPDDELIRIGTRHMEVSFTFDLDDARYRVTRSYSRSATGKTTSSDLEFQLHDPAAEAYRPLTKSTQRETQARIEDTLGLDYDTFINSAFLLQGRSDEFTNKSPSQRKEILVSILNLSRYEALEGAARDRWRAAKQRQQRLEGEVERLQAAVADVPDWEEERAAVATALEEHQEKLQSLRATEKELTQERASLEATAREVASLEATLKDIEARIADKQEARAALVEDIQEADERLSEAEDIEAAYDEYQSLQEERDALDEQREQHRRVETELEEARASLQEQRAELKRRLERLTVERKNLKQNLNECEQALTDHADVVQSLRAAQAARQQAAEWAAVRDRRDRLQARQEEARRALVGARQQLRGELESLQEQIQEESSTVEALDALDARIESLETKKERRAELEEQLSAIESKGKTVAEKIQEHTGQLEARRQEHEREEAELRRFRQAEGPHCPTCGTQLTPDHRDEVEATLQSSMHELEQHIQAQQDRLQALRERRATLRRQYTDLRDQLNDLEAVGEALATAREQKRSLRERAEALTEKREKARRIQRRLENGTYGAEHRRRWQWCAQRQAALSFDPDRFETLQSHAAQVDRYADRLRELRARAERRDALAERIETHEEEIDTLQRQLDEQTAVADLRSRIADLESELESQDFSPERFQAVRERLEALSHVPDQMHELRQARDKRADWVERTERIDDRIDELTATQEETEARLAELREELEGREALDERIAEVEAQVEATETAVSEAQQTLGKLDERLEQAARDQEALEETRDELAEAKRDRHLHKHLRTAFGKHGIPSLIIEETLPEIEERANRILDRLTDGRMHVRLETLKEKKSGGTKETLDIILTDEQGVPRPYETFSGGESFRVNFALRVSLAQLLAERSGVRVRTLVIDEGFGTQDEDGIERLVEAIQAIREDFAKILVITHLPRLKDAFPVRVEVEKDPVTGSTFDLVGA